MTTLVNYLFDKIYYGTSWDLVTYPDEIVEAIKQIIRKGKSLTPDPLTMLSLEVGYISELQIQTGDFKLSTSKMMNWIYGDEVERYVMHNKKGNFSASDNMIVTTINKQIWSMLSSEEDYITEGMLDWKKVLDQMLWHNYQLLVGIKLVNRLQNDFPETIKESLRDEETWRGNMMQLFSNGHLYGEEGTKGNKWVNEPSCDILKEY